MATHGQHRREWQLLIHSARRRLPASVQHGLWWALTSLPGGVQARLRSVVGSGQLEPVRWGSLRRLRPLDRNWGFGRGTPVDRVYIEAFLATHAPDIRGDCLEVLNDNYTRRFGGAWVRRSDVLDVNPANPAATLIADLGEPESLPPERFDCFVFTQTLHLVADMRLALANAWRAVRPGGVMLMTVPAAGRHVSQPGFDHDRWRLTPPGLQWLLDELPDAESDLASYGNVLACTAAFHGVAAEELSAAELEACDPEYPLIVAARVRKAMTP